jgi:hypothetical protein
MKVFDVWELYTFLSFAWLGVRGLAMAFGWMGAWSPSTAGNEQTWALWIPLMHLAIQVNTIDHYAHRRTRSFVMTCSIARLLIRHQSSVPPCTSLSDRHQVSLIGSASLPPSS